MLKFRKIEEKDFVLLFEWLQKPHVKKWWDDGDDTLDKVISHYSSNSEGTKRYILLENNIPIGYFQYYINKADTVGIDLFIGEETKLNKGIASKAINEFISLIKSRENPKKIMVDPELKNIKAIKFYKKCGFIHFKTSSNIDGKETYWMEKII